MLIMTYNIRGGLGIDNKRSLPRIADVIRESHAQVVCVQEVGRKWPASNFVDQPKWLGDRLGMSFVYQPNLVIGPAAFGNLLLSRFPVTSAKSHPLTSSGEQRGLLEVAISTPEGDVTVFCTHWGLDGTERIGQSAEASSIVNAVTGPKFVCGDLNDTLTSEPVANLLASSSLRDLAGEAGTTDLTFPTDKREVRIDFVLGSSDIKVSEARVIESPASDHLPVLVEATINPP